ncbi:MAG TPA: hypothetical protein PKI19_08625 [Elusimicrobiales bacterium]|nr:hypothetical protein [Elusimicrobiales bacterium]
MKNSKRSTLVLSIVLAITGVGAVYSQDKGITLNVADDLTVFGVDGTKADADLKVKGYSVFGATSAAYPAVVTYGAGGVFMSNLEVGANAYLWGKLGVSTGAPQGLFDVKDFFTVTESGRVGVGTISPGYLFEAAGGGHFTSSMTVDGGYYGDGSRLTGVITSTAAITARIDDVAVSTGVLQASLDAVIASTGTIADSLGSHVATTTLQMSGFDIAGVSTITTAGPFVAVATNVYVAGNLGLGIENPQQKLEVNGYVKAAGFCIGNNCQVGTLGVFVGATATAYNGNRGGYTTINGLCNAQYTGSHVCTNPEILFSIYSGNFASFPVATLWIVNGPPGYAANSNDCQGWKSGAFADYGPVWNKTSAGDDGFGSLNHCDSSPNLRQFACCR